MQNGAPSQGLVMGAEPATVSRRPFFILHSAFFIPPWVRRLLETRLVGTGLGISALVVLCALFAGLIAPCDPTVQDYLALTEPPSAAHLLGTDDLGRDVLSRIIYGSRVSLQVGIIAVGIAVGLGVTLGLVSGYVGGLVDDV